MPRSLPASLTSALDSGSFTAYLAIGKRNYDATPPTSLEGYTRLITNILYYKYDGLELVVKYASANMPADDGLEVGSKYYLERGVLISGSPVTIRTASLRFDDYSINRQIITAYFSLFSPDEKPTVIDGYDTYTNVLTSMNPNAYWLGTVDFVPTPENADHWGYKFYPSGKQVIPKSYAALLPHYRQKYLIQAVDNSDNTNENEVQFYHLRSPVNTVYWRLRSTEAIKIYDVVYSSSLSLFVAVGIDASNVPYIQTSNQEGITWNAASLVGLPFQPHGIAWSPTLAMYAMCGLNASGTKAIATSTDGTNWTERDSPNTLYSMAWSPELSLFVAMGRYIATSPDGVTWTERTNPTTNSFPGICWAAELGLFVAVSWGGGAGQRVLTSPDGITWTEHAATEAVNWKDVAWSPELGLLAAVAENGTNRVMTSPDGITWTARAHAGTVNYQSVAWSSLHAKFYAVCDTGELMYSSDGITWTAEAAPTASTFEKIVWDPNTSTFIITAKAGTYNIVTSVAALIPDHTIEQGDVTLLRNGVTQSFLWRDELESIHESGGSSSIVHNLGYLESTASPPVSFVNADRGKVTVGIHLKYKSGDIFKLKINDTQFALYLGKVTEVLDPAAAIGWRCEIELIERFENTVAGALPSTIERIASYTPLVTTRFNGFLDATVNNLQAFADYVDDAGLGLMNGWVKVTEQWTRTGNYTFTIPTDYTSKYILGLRIRYTEGGSYEYGVVISSSYSAGTDLTTVTLATNNDYAIATTTMVGRHISLAENPIGYPHWFNYTPTGSASGSMTYTVTTVNRAKFSVLGRRCDVSIYVVGTTGGTASNTLYLTYPITPSNYDDCLAAATRDATTGPPDLGRGSANAAGLFCRKYDASNYGLGTGRYFLSTGYYLL
jgi:hypothetical protein